MNWVVFFSQSEQFSFTVYQLRESRTKAPVDKSPVNKSPTDKSLAQLLTSSQRKTDSVSFLASVRSVCICKTNASSQELTYKVSQNHLELFLKPYVAEVVGTTTRLQCIWKQHGSICWLINSSKTLQLVTVCHKIAASCCQYRLEFIEISQLKIQPLCLFFSVKTSNCKVQLEEMSFSS